MNANTPLWKAHDISQQLQDKIEVLPNVERAFVHVDHETDHIPVRSFTFASLHLLTGCMLFLLGTPKVIIVRPRCGNILILENHNKYHDCFFFES